MPPARSGSTSVSGCSSPSTRPEHLRTRSSSTSASWCRPRAQYITATLFTLVSVPPAQRPLPHRHHHCRRRLRRLDTPAPPLRQKQKGHTEQAANAVAAAALSSTPPTKRGQPEEAALVAVGPHSIKRSRRLQPLGYPRPEGTHYLRGGNCRLQHHCRRHSIATRYRRRRRNGAAAGAVSAAAAAVPATAAGRVPDQ